MNGVGAEERALYYASFASGFADGEYDGEWNPAGSHDAEAQLREDVRVYRECHAGRATRIAALGEARGYRAALAEARTEPKRTVLS